ncbi:MAG TPA: VOC family protein [Microlunatus sp.]|jgi:PhnB protein|nr:VOC family protein [Microlunatus sp.]
MTGLTPYLSFPGTARQALTFYQGVFGGKLVLNTLADFGREDGPADAIAHGMLQGPVELLASDADPEDPALRLDGVLFSLLGTAEPATMEAWFSALSDGGRDIDPLQLRPWGDHDGQVTDRFGVRWLIGYQG